MFWIVAILCQIFNMLESCIACLQKVLHLIDSIEKHATYYFDGSFVEILKNTSLSFFQATQVPRPLHVAEY